MSTTHKLRVEPKNVIRTPSRKTVARKLQASEKSADQLDGFKMKPGYLYTVVRAISARVNQNYDGWPSEELKKSAHTFVGKPVFVNHENYDPKKARGVVVASRYVENGADKYIEVIQEIDAKRFPKLANEIRTGGLDSVSMGAEAGFTICSYCGNKAQDVPDMCDHVLFHKGEKLSRLNRKTGKREEVLVYESCHKLSFFELSYVFDPADETAVASKVLVAGRDVGVGPSRGHGPTQPWSRPRDKSKLDKSRWPVNLEQGEGPDEEERQSDYTLAVLKAAGFDDSDEQTVEPTDDRDRELTINDRQKSKIDKGDKTVTEEVKTNTGDGSDAEGKKPSKKAASFEDRVLKVAGFHVHSAECPPGKDCDLSNLDPAKQITPDSANNPLNQQGGGSSSGAGAAAGAATAVGGGDLGDPADVASGGSPDASGILPQSRGLYDNILKDHPGTDIGGYRVDDYHEHDSGALDVMTSDPAVADSVKQKAFDAGAPYVLWQQTQWNADGTSSPMEDRGSPTQNHMDHVHTAPISASFERRVLMAAGMSPFTDSSGRYQGPMKTKTSYPPSPYGEGDSCPECGLHFTQGHAPGCSHASKWGSKMPQAGKYTKDDFAIADGKKPWERETAEPEAETASEAAYTAAVLRAAGYKVAGRDRQQSGFGDPDWRDQSDEAEVEGVDYDPEEDRKALEEWRKKKQGFKTSDGRHRMPNLPGRHEQGADYDPRRPPEGYQVYDAKDWLNRPQEFEARVLEAAGWSGDVQTPPDDRHQQLWQQHYQKHLDSGMLPDLAREKANKSIDFVKSRGWMGTDNPNPMPQKNRVQELVMRNLQSSFEAKVIKAWGETEAPAAVDTLREEGSAPEDDNNDFYHYVEPPKELQTPDLSEAAQIDREQDQQGYDTDGAPGPYSPDAGVPGAPGGMPGQEQQPQQQYMELKIPIPSPGQAGAPGASTIPMQPYQAQPPQAPMPPAPSPNPGQQIAASTLEYFDRYFGHRVGREKNLQTLENGHAAFTKSRNPMKGTANMARSTLAERGKVVTAGRRQHFAEGPLVDTGDQSRNDQGEQEEVFITQTPPAEPVDAPTDDTPNISNTENNLVAKVQRGRQQLLRDAQALAAWRAKQGKTRTAGDQDEAGGPVATEVNPTVNTGPAGEALTGDDFESADPNADVVETQPKDASLHAFKSFDKWLAAKTGKPCRQHTSATIRRAADDYSRAAGISVQAMFPALGIVLREARKNEKPNTKGAKMRKRADEKLEVAAPDGRIDVEAPTEDTTDEEAQASQFDLHDFGNNAGDNLADPDLSTDQNWAPGEANKTSKVKTAGGILAFRCAEAMIAAGLEPNTVERKYQLATSYENMNRGLIQAQTALCEKFAAVLRAERQKVASGSTRGAALQSPVPTGLTQGAQRTAGVARVAANDPRNDSSLFV